MLKNCKLKLLSSVTLLFFSHSLYAFSIPERTALIDTGYDACLANKGAHCAQNKNLLFRGSLPLDKYNEFSYDANALRTKVYAYLREFKQVYATRAPLPMSLADLKSYRIVMIDLVYDGTQFGNDFEFTALQHEFKHSGQAQNSDTPLQHHLYGITSPFQADQFAFAWWPLTMWGKSNPENIDINLNWPQHETIPVPHTQQYYQAMDLPYLVTGKAYADDEEQDAMDLRSLLTMQPADGHPLLIYYHCIYGMDRTGAVTLSYLMQHGGYANVSNANSATAMQRSGPLTFMQALAATTENNYPVPDREALLAAQAYCLASGKSALDCEIR